MLLAACDSNKASRLPAGFKYEALKDSISKEINWTSADTINLFDDTAFRPGIDSFDKLLVRIDTLWRLEVDSMEQEDKLSKLERQKETYTTRDKKTVLENIRVLDSFLIHRNNIPPVVCEGNGCLLFAEVVLPRQQLYLYLEGELVDSFKVSTGVKGYETPEMDRRPSGPLFTKYTSKKFPGGNYQGLGNMPYAVFIRGGYAIHGTTTGNFSKLGNRASHGCIRLHPNNAKLFYELVKMIGLENTWVSVTNEQSHF